MSILHEHFGVGVDLLLVAMDVDPDRVDVDAVLARVWAEVTPLYRMDDLTDLQLGTWRGILARDVWRTVELCHATWWWRRSPWPNRIPGTRVAWRGKAPVRRRTAVASGGTRSRGTLWPIRSVAPGAPGPAHLAGHPVGGRFRSDGVRPCPQPIYASLPGCLPVVRPDAVPGSMSDHSMSDHRGRTAGGLPPGCGVWTSRAWPGSAGSSRTCAGGRLRDHR
jgi:hypothetical protein